MTPSTHGAKALDLGCGSGFQTIPLLELGYDVTAIDMSDELLQELEGHRASRAASSSSSLTVLQGDISALPSLLPSPQALGSFELAVCMGDTLTHLQSMAQVRTVVADAASFLKPGGVLVLHFRDLTYHLEGTDRFLPCQTDENNIFTCVLEYEDGDKREEQKEDRFVLINDLLYSRPDSSSAWTFKKSQFKKLEVPPEKVLEMMQAEGMETSLHPLAFGLVAAMGVLKAKSTQQG